MNAMTRIRLVKLLLLVTLAFLFYLCYGVYLRKKQMHESMSRPSDDTVVASVSGRCLYQSDLDQVFALCGDGKEVSSEMVDNYIDQWAFVRIIQNGDGGLLRGYNVVNQIKQYELDILSHKFLENEINKTCLEDVSISDQEIVDYYNAHQQDFILNEDFVKGLVVVLPVKYKEHVNKLKGWMLSAGSADLENLKRFCTEFAKSYHLDADQWIHARRISSWVGHTPHSIVSMFKKKGLVQYIHNDCIYLFKVHDYTASCEVAPLEVLKQRIVAIISHNKRMTLAKQKKRQILQDAKNKKSYVRYTG